MLAFGVTSVLLILIGWVGVRAQEITYNLEPTHELGPELWSIPIGGKLTMSADGTRMLVASIADSAFFGVNVESGEYRKTPARFYADNTFGYTYYRVDNDVTVLFEGGNWVEDGDRYWDLAADTLLATSNDIGVILGVSRQLDRLVTSYGLVEFSTMKRIKDYDYGTHPGYWFDEARNLLYRGTINQVDEVDINTGETLRSWSVRAARSEVRRPKDSDWLYVFAIESNTLDGQNWVEAINLVTGEHLKFSKYFWSLTEGQPQFRNVYEFFGSTATSAYCSGQDGTHSQALWTFSAEDLTSQVVVDPRFLFDGRSGPKTPAVSFELNSYIHSWHVDWKDSSITRCNALVPVTTSLDLEVDGDSPLDPVTTRVVDDHLEIASRDAEVVVQHIDVATIDGSIVLQREFIDPALPIRVPIGHLANGTYVCSVQTSLGRYSSTFAIRR